MDLLYRLHHGWISLVFLLLLMAVAEGAWRAGRRAAPSEELRGQVVTLQAALLGLLGLLLAFTFAMSAGRFDQRRQLVLDEGDAIGTAWLRAMLLDEPAQSQLQDLLRRYTDARIAYYVAGVDEEAVEAALEEAVRLERAFWSLAVAQARKAPDPIRALVLTSLNAVIDLEEERLVTQRSHVPNGVVVLLLVVALAAVGCSGFGFGLVRRRHVAATLVLSVLVAAIVFVILDLDRPRRGLITVSQEPLLDLRQSMGEP